MTLRHTPFHAQHLAAGARMVDFAGWHMPVQYAGVRQEHAAVREAVGLFDVSHMGEVAFSGPHALAALQWLLTADIAAIDVGHAGYSAMCNDGGGVVDDVFVYHLADASYLVVVNAANRDKDVAWMLDHNPHGADITDVSDHWALLAVQGPRAEDTIRRLAGDVAALPSRGVTRATVEGVPCLVARTGYTGEDGFEIFAPAHRAEPLWGALLEAGTPFGIAPAGLGARDTLRLEARNCLYGNELTDDTSPFQAGIGWVVALDKPGGFVGADALRDRKGTESHRLVGIVLDGKRIARTGMDVLHDGDVVGHVTSGTRAPTLDQSIALAYVQRDLVRPGTRLSVDVRGRTAEGEVVRGPFYSRSAGGAP